MIAKSKRRTREQPGMMAMVFVELPRCPRCQGDRLRVYKTREQKDGSRVQYSQCVACGQRMKVIWD